MKSVTIVRGIKRYKHPGTGIVYCYHRKTGKRIDADFGSPEFFSKLAEIEKVVKASEPLPGTLGLAISEYMQSPDWSNLRYKTRVSYERAFAVLKPLRDMPLAKIDRPFVFKLRDQKLFPKHGTWMANYAVTVLGIVLRFARDRGWIASNPLAEPVKKIKVAEDRSAPNRPWSEEECRVVIDRAPPQLKLPLALAMCAGLRKSDFLKVTLTSLRNGSITVRTSKRGVPISVPVHPILAQALETRPKSDAVQIAVNSLGQPWTETGFNASFRTFKKALEQEGVVAPGLTPHGLRHTLGTRLREAGADDRTIADVLGQKTSSMARRYSENAALPEQAQGLVRTLRLTETKNKG
ncbi:tyrosine-type recombinase/integrase [Rhodoblastus acidophilus]|uniref:Tyrosine-type recombinase/integrase n=1 Tax=Rhodoblastus acidophilus TaxID=1074 RepID=A0A6N8DVP3_RHOAC|nr:site-specific integrase [Rhodoblastus acidophilus]MCW2276272.1 integrase [Rhodoblastus acidophilus]MTV32934.1 tyrosine-type recombinase/integrase [Rhodoblastus acidophilus]